MENQDEAEKNEWAMLNAKDKESCRICNAPGKTYYEASKFSIENLDNLNVDYMKIELLELVISLQNLVVFIHRTFTQPDRNKLFLKSDVKNPETGANAQENNDTTNPFYGSGRIKWIEIKKEEDNETCSCFECKDSQNPKKEFCLVVIVTAAHVVIDDQEAASVTCYIDYNTDCFQGVVKLSGYKTKVVSTKQDRCEFYAVTHDKDIFRRFIKDYKRYHTANTCVYNKVEKYHTENKNAASTKTVILISHPHRLSKRISIGEIIKVISVNGPMKKTKKTQYYYNALACPGSSGGPVYRVGRKKAWSIHPHSMGVPSHLMGFPYSDEMVNISGIEWEFETSHLEKLIEELNESFKLATF